MSEPTISYAPRPETTSETELSAVANVLRFILDSHAKKEAAPERRPEDPERRSNEIRAKARIP